MRATYCDEHEAVYIDGFPPYLPAPAGAAHSPSAPRLAHP